MKNLFKISALVIITLFMVNCSNDDAPAANGGTVPSNGWRIGTKNYTTVFSLKNAGQPNSLIVFDALPNANNLNSVNVLFNNVSGIAAGTFKVVTKPNQEDLLADEIMIGVGTGYDQTEGKYDKDYAGVIGESVNAVVTIANGKVKIVIPQMNIVSIPINASSTTTTLAGTIIEQ